MSRDIRRMLTEIRTSLDVHPREALTEILAQLFKEYVVDGPAPVGAGAALLLNARSEIDGMNFTQLIQWLQSHHDAPELGQFEVQNERVLVRIGGRLVAIDAPGAPVAAALPTVAAPAPITSAQATVRAMPVSQTPAVNTSTSPARPTAAATPAPAAATPVAPAPSQAAAPRADETGDPASRFSYLEVD